MLPAANGKLLAGIELTVLPQPPGKLRDLPTAMRHAQETAIGAFNKAGLSDTCSVPVPSRGAGAAALRTECAARRSDTVLVRQSFVMWATPGQLASLSYTSGATRFAAHLAEFEQTLASIRPATPQ